MSEQDNLKTNEEGPERAPLSSEELANIKQWLMRRPDAHPDTLHGTALRLIADLERTRGFIDAFIGEAADCDCDPDRLDAKSGEAFSNMLGNHIEENCELRDRAEAAEAIIRGLVTLKDHKDACGKDGFYLKEQPIAWTKARKLIAALDGKEAPDA